MGENVSAGEVRGFISELPGVKDAVVVGRRLGKYDGQAETALIVLDQQSLEGTAGGDEEEERFMSHLFQALGGKGVPKYAVPRLVTVRHELVDVGDTFKHAKQVVKNIDWGATSTVTGRQYYLDLEAETFKPLDRQAWARIEDGRAKL
jgi:acyl-CoA synthetase (AMP-forming)/AMP-acid ligase II